MLDTSKTEVPKQSSLTSSSQVMEPHNQGIRKLFYEFLPNNIIEMSHKYSRYEDYI